MAISTTTYSHSVLNVDLALRGKLK